MNTYSSIGSLTGNDIRNKYMSGPSNVKIEGEILSKDGKNLRIQTKNEEVLDISLKKDMEVK